MMSANRFIVSLGLLIFFSSGVMGASNRILTICDDVADPATLDPQKQFSEKNHTLLQQIYEGLVRFDPDGKIEPNLAESWEQVDPLKMRFHLRKGVYFHNGEPFTAEAVRFSIERYLNPETGFPAIGFISSIDHAEVLDDYTVDIVTKFPDGLLINRLAGFILIVPPNYFHNARKEDTEAVPVGTGPYIFVSWEKGKSIELKANLNYRQKGFPKVAGLIFRFLPLEEQINGMLNGTIDIMTELPGTRTTEIAESKLAKVVKGKSFYAVFGCLDIDSKPLGSRIVRQALNFAINREEIIRYDVLGNGFPLATITMPGEEGHNESLKPYPYDPAKAKELLRQAGYSEGFHLNVLVKEQGSRTAGIIKKQFERVGVTLHLTRTTDADFLRNLSSKKWDMHMGGCPDPMVHSYFIQALLFYSKSPYSITRNASFDKFLEEIVVTLDAREREKKEKQLDAYVYQESLGLFMYQRLKTYAVNKHVRFTPSVTGMPHFLTLEITN